jgi:L-ribulokinase
MNLHDYLEQEAAKQRPGEHGLIALDWWNGNRSTLVDADLSGMLIGMTLATRAPDIYRALIESTAYGTREIIEAFETRGVPVKELVAAGGLPEKNALLRQIYADVTGRTLRLAGSAQSPALGSAMHAAVAAGVYPDIHAAAEKMGKLSDEVVEPIAENKAVYDQLYAEYRTLYTYFGRGANDVMKRLKQIRNEARKSEAVV